jgi:hypothetical protein
VNTGEVVVRSITSGAGQTEYTPIGHTTNLASRMQTLAPIGSIAATEVTRKLFLPARCGRMEGKLDRAETQHPGGSRRRRDSKLKRTQEHFLPRQLNRLAAGYLPLLGRDRVRDSSTESFCGASFGFRGIFFAIARRGVGFERMKKTSRDFGDLIDRGHERAFVRLGGFVEAGDLPHELQRGRMHLFGSDRRIEVEKNFDIPAHFAL